MPELHGPLQGLRTGGKREVKSGQAQAAAATGTRGQASGFTHLQWPAERGPGHRQQDRELHTQKHALTTGVHACVHVHVHMCVYRETWCLEIEGMQKIKVHLNSRSV